MWANEDAVIEAFDLAGFQMPNTEAANDRSWADGYFSRWPSPKSEFHPDFRADAPNDWKLM